MTFVVTARNSRIGAMTAETFIGKNAKRDANDFANYMIGAGYVVSLIPR